MKYLVLVIFFSFQAFAADGVSGLELCASAKGGAVKMKKKCKGNEVNIASVEDVQSISDVPVVYDANGVKIGNYVSELYGGIMMKIKDNYYRIDQVSEVSGARFARGGYAVGGYTVRANYESDDCSGPAYLELPLGPPDYFTGRYPFKNANLNYYLYNNKIYTFSAEDIERDLPIRSEEGLEDGECYPSGRGYSAIYIREGAGAELYDFDKHPTPWSVR